MGLLPGFFYLALKIAWELNEALAGVYAVSAIATIQAIRCG